MQVPQIWRSPQRQTPLHQWPFIHVGDQKPVLVKCVSLFPLDGMKKLPLSGYFCTRGTFFPPSVGLSDEVLQMFSLVDNDTRTPLLNLLDCNLCSSKKPTIRRAFKWKLSCNFEPLSLKNGSSHSLLSLILDFIRLDFVSLSPLNNNIEQRHCTFALTDLKDLLGRKQQGKKNQKSNQKTGLASPDHQGFPAEVNFEVPHTCFKCWSNVQKELMSLSGNAVFFKVLHLFLFPVSEGECPYSSSWWVMLLSSSLPPKLQIGQNCSFQHCCI